MRWLFALLASLLAITAGAQTVSLNSAPLCVAANDGLATDSAGKMVCRSYAGLFAIDDAVVPFPGFSDVTGRIGVPCALDPSKKNAVIVAIGQSNISSTTDQKYVSTSTAVDNFNFYDGGCYRLEDPVLGTSFRFGNGSYLGRIGDKLRAGGWADRVVVAGMAIDGRSVADWATGMVAHRVDVMARRLAAAKLRPTHIIWTQGEQDNTYGTTSADYAARLQVVVQKFRSYGIEAVFLVSQTTRLGGSTSASVRAGQAAVVSTSLNIKLGPDTDAILDRHDGIHFNAVGANSAAELWAAAIRAN